MKKFLLTCITGVLLFSCTEKKQVNYAIVSGTIKNLESTNVQLVSSDINLSLDTLEKVNHEIVLDENGSFSDTLFLDHKRNFTLIAGKRFMRANLQAGDHIIISMDNKDFPNSVIFEGDNAAVNAYLFKKSEINNRHNIEDRNAERPGEDAYIKKEDAKYNEYLQLLMSSKGLPDEFIENEKKDLLYSKVSAYFGYARSYKFYFGEDDPKLSESFLDITSTVNLADVNEYKRSTNYAFLIRSYCWYVAAKEGYPGKEDALIQLQLINDLFTEQKMKDEAFIMCGRYGIAETKKLQEYYDFFMANVQNKRYREHVTAQYKDLIATLPGQPAPEFVNYKNINGGTNSLKDFRGKYVYIDVWATWCGPCKAEIPYLIDVEKKYHNKNVEFISLSVDNMKNYSRWEKFVKDKELGGVQLIADKEWDSEFVQKFQIKGIPRFILIDPEGKIVAADAPRPSNPKLIELFSELGI